MISGCPGGLECDCVPERHEVRGANGEVIAVRAVHGGQRPYVGMGVHYVDRHDRRTCLVAFTAVIREEGLTLAILGPSGFEADGDVPHDETRQGGTWHHIHQPDTDGDPE